MTLHTFLLGVPSAVCTRQHLTSSTLTRFRPPACLLFCPCVVAPPTRTGPDYAPDRLPVPDPVSHIVNPDPVSHVLAPAYYKGRCGRWRHGSGVTPDLVFGHAMPCKACPLHAAGTHALQSTPQHPSAPQHRSCQRSVRAETQPLAAVCRNTQFPCNHIVANAEAAHSTSKHP